MCWCSLLRRQRPFENGDLIVSFHVRLRDGRARLLCETIRPARQRKDCTTYLTNMDVEREGQFLKFRRVSSSQRSRGLWGCLRFPSYESMPTLDTQPRNCC